MATFEEIHQCEQSKDKIVFIEVDKFGITYCGYCHEKVDYSQLDMDVPIRTARKQLQPGILLTYSEYQDFKNSLLKLEDAYRDFDEKLRTVGKKFGG